MGELLHYCVLAAHRRPRKKLLPLLRDLAARGERRQRSTSYCREPSAHVHVPRASERYCLYVLRQRRAYSLYTVLYRQLWSSRATSAQSGQKDTPQALTHCHPQATSNNVGLPEQQSLPASPTERTRISHSRAILASITTITRAQARFVIARLIGHSRPFQCLRLPAALPD